MLFISIFLVFAGIFMLIRNSIRKSNERRKEARRIKSVGELLNNPYILEHEKKMKDDDAYEEYLKWCKKNGELSMSKSGFDNFRVNEWKLNERIKKAMR